MSNVDLDVLMVVSDYFQVWCSSKWMDQSCPNEYAQIRGLSISFERLFVRCRWFRWTKPIEHCWTVHLFLLCKDSVLFCFQLNIEDGVQNVYLLSVTTQELINGYWWNRWVRDGNIWELLCTMDVCTQLVVETMPVNYHLLKNIIRAQTIGLTLSPWIIADLGYFYLLNDKVYMFVIANSWIGVDYCKNALRIQKYPQIFFRECFF